MVSDHFPHQTKNRSTSMVVINALDLVAILDWPHFTFRRVVGDHISFREDVKRHQNDQEYFTL